MLQRKKYIPKDQKDDLESGPTEASMILKNATDPELHLWLMNSLLKVKGSGKVIPSQLPEETGKKLQQTQGGASQSYPYFPQQVSHDIEGWYPGRRREGGPTCGVI